MTSRRPRWPILAALLISICGLMAAPPKIAVFNFTDATGSSGLDQMIPDLIEICLLASPDEVVVLERRQIDDLLREHSLSLAQATDQHALQLGRILATDYLAFGGIRKEGAALVISMRLVDSKTTEIKALDEVSGEIAQFNTLLPLLIGKVLAKLQNADEATAEQLAARHRTPAGMPIERFTAAMAAAEQLDFGNALAHIRACLSLDPAYSESRSRFVPKELPEVPSISVSDMTGDKQPHAMVSLIKKLYRNVRHTGKPDKERDPEFLSSGWDPKGFRVYDNYRKKHLLTLPPNPISKHVHVNEYRRYENFQYDHVSGKLYSIYINNFATATPPSYYVSAWDMADGKMVADWEGEGIVGEYKNSYPGLGYFTGKSLELFIPMISEKPHPIEGYNEEQKLIYWNIHDFLSGQKVTTIHPPFPMASEGFGPIGKSSLNGRTSCIGNRIFLRSFGVWLNPGSGDEYDQWVIFSFTDLVSGKQLGTFFQPRASFLKTSGSDPQPSVLVALQGGDKLMDLARLDDGAWLMSRTEISTRYDLDGWQSFGTRFTTPSLQHMFGDDRAYLALVTLDPSLRVGFLQLGLLAPAIYGPNDIGKSMVADLDGDGTPEIFNERKVYAFTETMPYHPQEHHLVDTWVFSTSGMNDKAHEELRRRHAAGQDPGTFSNNAHRAHEELRRRHAAGQEIKGNKSEQWKDNWWRFQNCSLPLIRSMAGDRSRHYVFDSRGLGHLVKQQRILPEVDVDDFSRTRSYHLIRARWQLTMMLDYTLGDDYIAKCEILDKSRPIHAPAFFTEKTGPDLNANVMACLREANAFLAANNVVLPSHGEGDTPPALAAKIPLTILNLDALAVPRRSSNYQAASNIGQTLLGAFERTGKFRLLERAELRTILEEQNLARLGRQTEAPSIVPSAIVIAGAMVPVGAGHHLSLRAYDTETGIIFSSLTHGGDQPGFQITPETIDAYARQLADDVARFQPYKYRLMSEIYLDYLRYMAVGQERTLPSASAPTSSQP